MSGNDKATRNGGGQAEIETYEAVLEASDQHNLTAAADAVSTTDAEIEALRIEVDRLRMTEQEHRDEVLRARAEVENIRRRAQRDVEAAHRYGLERLIAELLTVKDSMDLGQAAAQDSTDVSSLREGIELTLRMFNTALEKVGVQEVNPLGEKFNPDYHQAMSMEESAEAEPGTVVRVMQKGYLLNERLVRPAMVIVAKAVEHADA